MKKNSFLLFLIILYIFSSCVKTQIVIEKKKPQEKIISEVHISEKVKIIFTGDIMVHKTFLKAFKKNNEYDFKPLYNEIKDKLKGDIVFGNLETTLAGKKRGYSGYPDFRSPDPILDALKDANLTHLNLANNHSMDSGITGLFRTNKICKEKGFRTIGTYLSKEEKHYLIEEIKGFRFGFLSYTYGVNGVKPNKKNNYTLSFINKENMKKELEELKKKDVDFIFVILHLGTEYKFEANEKQKEITKFLFEHGANFIIGMHSHTIQPFSFNSNYKDPEFVAYSLGNFSSVQCHHNTDIGTILTLEFYRSDNYKAFSAYDFTITFRKKNGNSFVILPYDKAIVDEKISTEKKKLLNHFNILME